MITILLGHYDISILDEGKHKYYSGMLNQPNINMVGTRCLYNVYALDFLLRGGNKKNVKNLQNPKKLIDIINYSIHIKSYYMVISIFPKLYQNNGLIIYESPVNHIFLLLKNDTKYYIVQSYLGAYCPKINPYTKDDIIVMINELSKIYYDDNDGELTNRNWSIEDNNTWKKYFEVDESSRPNIKIDSNESKYGQVKIKKSDIKNQDLHCINFFYTMSTIDSSICYKNLHKVLLKTESEIHNLFKTYIEQILCSPMEVTLTIDLINLIKKTIS